MMREEKLAQAICSVIYPVPKGDDAVIIIPNNGVFITPFHVLTSWHIIQEAAKHAKDHYAVTFENNWGEKVSIKPALLENAFHDAAKDLAIIELDNPIGYGLTLEPITSATLEESPSEDTVLVAEFQRQISVNLAVEVEDLTRRYRDSGLISDDFSGFSTYASIEGGFSGAPVVNNQDRVISILSGEPRSEVGLQEPGRIKPFIAPSPRALAEFIDEFMEEVLGLD